MTDKKLRDNFLNLSINELHNMYYQSNINGDEILFSHSISKRLGFKQTLNYTDQKFICPDKYLTVFQACVIKFGNMLYRYEQSGNNWRNLTTVKDLI